MKRLVTAMIAAAVTLVATSCGSDPAPLGSGTEVDRSSAEATAVAFANIYATGDVPAACQLATDQGRSAIGKKCESAQQWKTSVVMQSDCASVPSVPGAEARSFLFEAPEPVLNGEDHLRVGVEKASGDTMWSVSSASTPYKGEPYSPCLDAQPSSVVLTPAPSSS